MAQLSDPRWIAAQEEFLSVRRMQGSDMAALVENFVGQWLDLRKIDVPSYVVAGSTDHIVPWANSWRSAALLGGPVRFVLSTSGHVQAIDARR